METKAPYCRECGDYRNLQKTGGRDQSMICIVCYNQIKEKFMDDIKAIELCEDLATFRRESQYGTIFVQKVESKLHDILSNYQTRITKLEKALRFYSVEYDNGDKARKALL